MRKSRDKKGRGKEVKFKKKRKGKLEEKRSELGIRREGRKGEKGETEGRTKSDGCVGVSGCKGNEKWVLGRGVKAVGRGRDALIGEWVREWGKLA